MKRRAFFQAGAAASAAILLSKRATAEVRSGQPGFKLKYAPHFGMFQESAGTDPVDQLTFAAERGFRAWEDNGMRSRPVAEQERIAKAMNDLKMEMGVFVANGGFGKITFAGKNTDERDRVLADMKASVEVAKRVNAKWMTVVPGDYDRGKEWGYQTANCVELLRRCCEILEPHNLVIVLEPLNWWTNHAGLFLHKIPQAYQVCRAVDSPSCKILFDIYHQQISEGNLIPNMDMSWDEIGYFQCGDNPGRNEPGTGEINYANVFGHIHAKGYTGIVGMEHGNSKPGKAGEEAVIESYLKADQFAED